MSNAANHNSGTVVQPFATKAWAQSCDTPASYREAFATFMFTSPFARVSAHTARFTKICWIARKRGDFAKRYCAISISNARLLH